MKKSLTCIRLMMGVVTIMAILAMVAVPTACSNNNSGDNDAQIMLRSFAMAQKAYKEKNYDYIISRSTRNIHNILSELGEFGFRSDPNVAFGILHSEPESFYIIAAHKDVGSKVFYYYSHNSADYEKILGKKGEGEGYLEKGLPGSHAPRPHGNDLFFYTSTVDSDSVGRAKTTFTQGTSLGDAGAATHDAYATLRADPNDGNIYKVTLDGSRTQALLKQLALANEACNVDNNKYVTNLADMNTGINMLGNYGFRSDPNVAFNIVPLTNGGTEASFVAYAAHRSAGSVVYYYDTTKGVAPYTVGASKAASPTANSLFVYTVKKGQRWGSLMFIRGAPLAAIAADTNDGGIFKVTADRQ